MESGHLVYEGLHNDATRLHIRVIVAALEFDLAFSVLSNVDRRLVAYASTLVVGFRELFHDFAGGVEE